MVKVNTHGLTVINDAVSFPSEAGRYSVRFEGDWGVDTSGLMSSFEGACAEAAELLRERADHVLVFDRVRGYAVACGKA